MTDYDYDNRRDRYLRTQEESVQYSRDYRAIKGKLINAKRRQRRADIRAIASRFGQPWTEDDDQIVLAMKSRDLEIACELGRSIDEVQNRRRRLRPALIEEVR